jgi:uncharacterized protein (TIGR02145 family)
MKQLSTLLFCLFLFTGLAAQNLPSYLPSNGLVGWWPFNGNAQDESGNGNHGTVNGATLTADRFGNVGKAYDFNGTSNYIDMGNSPNLSFTGSFTVACWINPDSVPRPFNQNGFNTMAIVDKAIQNTLGGYRLDYTADSLLRIVGFQFQLSNANIRTRRWTHLVYTLNSLNQTTKIYFNGVLDKTIANVSALTISSTNLWVGAASATNGFPNQLWFGGKIDDIAIYNRALGQEEITNLYQAGNETSLSYQLSQEKLGNCKDSPVKLSVQTSVRLKTDSAGSVGNNSATAYGNILNDGGKTITRRGFCWGTSANPTLSNSFSENGSGSGAFNGSLSSLSPSTTYYLRAYAGTATEVWYGNELTFTTASGSVSSATCGTPNIHNPNLSYGSMSDQDGNVYKTIVIGTQEWMAENLKTGHYRNGEKIPVVTDGAAWSGVTTGASCWYGNDSASYNCPYGRLYNWYTVADPRGLCPTGWHVPSDDEWKTMELLLGMPDSELNQLGDQRGSTQNIGGKLKSVSDLWASFNAGASNESGFSALPSGLREAAGIFRYVGEAGFWWPSTENSINDAWSRILGRWGSFSARNNDPKANGKSVRCLKDAPETGSINSLDCGGAVNTGTIYAGQAALGASTTINYSGGNGGSFSSRVISSTGVTGLTATLAAGSFADGDGSLYFAITGIPTGTGIVSFELNLGGKSCVFSALVVAAGNGVTDVDGNIYRSVLIGDQEWMSENLKVSKYRNGDLIPTNLSDSDWQNTTNGAYSTYENNPLNNTVYGKLYNWHTVVDPRGLCPQDWHAPSETDWEILKEFLGGPGPAGGKLKAIGTIEAGTGLWNSPNLGASNNSGFNALPGGIHFYQGSYGGLGVSGGWWATTGYPSSTAAALTLWNLYEAAFPNGNGNTNNGYSVRCLKNTPEIGRINGLDCGGAVSSGIIRPGISTKNFFTTISYTGGNGLAYGSRIFTSTGVIGLSAKLESGHFSNGNGSITFSIIGMPVSSGTARFAIFIGGISCELSVDVLPTGSIVTDIDGNTYGSVVIGEQIWMNENLKVSRYRNGDALPHYMHLPDWENTTNGVYTYYENSPVNNKTYGKLYNWYAVADPRGLCPTGWHVPSDTEWFFLENYLDSTVNNPNNGGLQGVTVGGKLKMDSQIWQSPNTGASNSSGFNALPGGNVGTEFSNIGKYGVWWSFTNPDTDGYTRYLSFESSGTWRFSFAKTSGFSVRCLKDPVENGTINSLGCSDAICNTGLFTSQRISNATISIPYTGGNGGNFSKKMALSTGVYGLSATLEAGNFANGDGNLILKLNGTPSNSGQARFDFTIGGKSCNFSLLSVTIGNGLTDIDGNTYGSVIIGNQEWMSENLKVSKYRNGDLIDQVIDDNLWATIWNNGSPTGQPAWCYYNNDASNNTSYGKLYNWFSVSDQRGLCPSNWHVPSDEEWKTLEAHLNMQTTELNLVGSRGELQNVGGMLKSVSTLWNSPNLGATNGSGFSALPASHRRVDGSFIQLGSKGFWWTITNYSSTDAFSRHLSSDKGDILRYNDYKANAFSVRCLKD